MMTVVRCSYCNRQCGGPAGLASHIRAMHADAVHRYPATDQISAAPLPTTDGIMWEDPPPRGRGPRFRIARLAPQLRRNPGRWARLYTGRSKSSAGSVKKAIREHHPELADIELEARTVDGIGVLYGRYVEPAIAADMEE